MDQPSPLRSGARYWPIVLVLAALGAAGGVGLGYSQPDVVTAESRVGVGNGGLDAFQVPGFAKASSDLAANYARYVERAQFDPALRAALTSSVGNVRSVAASPIPDSNVIRIETTSTSAATSARAAQVVADQLIAQVKAADTRQTAAQVKAQVDKLAVQVAQATAERQRAETAFAKARNAPGGSPADPDDDSEPTAAQRAADAAQTAQVAAQAKVSSLQVQFDAVKRQYGDLVNEPASQSGLILVASGHATSHSRSAAVQRYGLAGLVAGLVLAFALSSLLDRRRVRRAATAGGREDALHRSGVRPVTGAADPHTT